ncbi:hypothetical protein V1273_001013 [Bradyrhizobium sp. AZCC 1721]
MIHPTIERRNKISIEEGRRDLRLPRAAAQTAHRNAGTQVPYGSSKTKTPPPPCAYHALGEAALLFDRDT